MQQKAGELQGWWSGEEGLPGPSLGRAPALDRWALRMKAHIWRRAWVPAAGGLSAPRSPTHKTAPAPQRGPRASEILSQVPSWDWPLLVSEQGGDSPDCLQGAWHVVLLKENLTVISLEAAEPGTHVLHVDVGLCACLHELDSIVQGQLGGRETHM